MQLTQLALAISTALASCVAVVSCAKLWLETRKSKSTPNYLYSDRFELKGVPRYPALKEEIQFYSADDLLLSQADHVADIAKLAGENFCFIEPSLKRLADYVQLLPASEADHHSHLGGLFRHILEVTYISLSMRQGRILSQDIPPSQKRSRIAAHILATAYAAITHDIGKVLSDIVVTCAKTGERWNPVNESMTEWAKRRNVKTYIIEYMRARVHKRHELSSPAIAHNIIDKAGLAKIQELSPDLLTDLMSVLHSPRTDLLPGHNAKMLLDLIHQADIYSVTKDRESSRAFAAESTNRKPVIEILLDALKKSLMDDRVNMHGSTFAICYASNRVKDLLRENAEDEILLLNFDSFYKALREKTHDDRLDALKVTGAITTLVDYGAIHSLTMNDSVTTNATIKALPDKHEAPVGPRIFVSHVILNKDMFDYVFPRAIHAEYSASEDGKSDHSSSKKDFDERERKQEAAEAAITAPPKPVKKPATPVPAEAPAESSKEIDAEIDDGKAPEAGISATDEKQAVDTPAPENEGADEFENLDMKPEDELALALEKEASTDDGSAEKPQEESDDEYADLEQPAAPTETVHHEESSEWDHCDDEYDEIAMAIEAAPPNSATTEEFDPVGMFVGDLETQMDEPSAPEQAAPEQVASAAKQKPIDALIERITPNAGLNSVLVEDISAELQMHQISIDALMDAIKEKSYTVKKVNQGKTLLINKGN